MRALFTATPARGSLAALTPVAVALREAGHRVAFCSSTSFRPQVESAGFTCFEAGIDWLAGRPMPDPPSVAEINRRMVADVVAVARRWGADLIVREAIELAGSAAAEVLGLPHASVASGADSALDLRRELAGLLGDLREASGLPHDPAGDMPYRYLHLCFWPPDFDGPDATFPPTAHFLRYSPVPVAPPPPLDWEPRLAGRPVVVVSFGTVVAGLAGLYEAVVDGLEGEAVNLVVCLGPGQDPHRLGRRGPNVQVVGDVALPALLAGAALLVTHAGINSVKEAVHASVPMVVAPVAGDQHYCAGRCVAAGVAELVARDDRTPARFRQAALAVLADPAYAAAVARLRDRMLALPPLDVAVRLLEQLASERRPIQVGEAQADRTGVPSGGKR